MIIPIIIICYNNYKYVENTLNQLLSISKDLGNNIIILDNKSTCEKTIQYLKTVNQLVFYNKENNGPWITKENNGELYNLLPNKFIVTDPDLELNPELPQNFIEILVSLSEKYKCEKVGFALDITETDKMFTGPYTWGKDIKTWESKFWINKIPDDMYELYRAQIDTTFALITKDNPPGDIRIAGNFTAKHLPWYINNKIYNIYDNYMSSTQSTKISTMSSLIMNYTYENFEMIRKNNELFFFKKGNEFNKFWIEEYPKWKDSQFMVLDRFLKKDKSYIELGAKIGQTAIYSARKSKHIYFLENYIDNLNYLIEACKNNIENYTIINGTIMDFLNNIPDNISLITVNLDGKEEYILSTLFEIHSTKNIPLLITFNYSNWKYKSIVRFKFLSESQRELIKNNNEATLIFINQT